MPKNEISDMEITEISLVDEPANDDARVVIVKAKGGFKPCADCSDAEGCMKKGSCASDKDGDEGKMKKAAAPLSAARVAGAILTAITELSPQIVEKALAEGFSAHPEAADMAEEIIKETVMDITQLSKALEQAEADMEALTKRATDAETALKVANETIAKAKAEEKPAEPTEEEILKSLPESVRKRLEKAKEDEVALAKMAEAAEEKEAIDKARAMKVAEPEKIGALLLRIAKGKTTAEDAKAIEAVLKQNAAIIEKAPLFKSIGTAAAVEGDPEEILKAKANEIQTASEGKMTFAQAYDEALKRNPTVYEAYIAKRRAA
jgi:small-conductance mechanosensitive channel